MMTWYVPYSVAVLGRKRQTLLRRYRAACPINLTPAGIWVESSNEETSTTGPTSGPTSGSTVLFTGRLPF